MPPTTTRCSRSWRSRAGRQRLWLHWFASLRARRRAPVSGERRVEIARRVHLRNHVIGQRRAGVDPDFGGASYDALSLQRRSPDGVWSDAVPLVSSADRPGYVCYHQKLTVDRRGRLYLSLSYYNPALYPPKQRRANRFRYRMVLISKDGGASWDFATTLDFLEGMAPQD